MNQWYLVRDEVLLHGSANLSRLVALYQVIICLALIPSAFVESSNPTRIISLSFLHSQVHSKLDSV